MSEFRDGLVGYGSLLRNDSATALGLERVVDRDAGVAFAAGALALQSRLFGRTARFLDGVPLRGSARHSHGLGCTVNDVVLTVVAGAVAKYTKLHGQTVKNRFFRPMVPVNVRPAEDSIGAFGNLISLMLVALPLGIRDPIASASNTFTN